MDDLVQLLHITPAADVQKKWRITDDRFEDIVRTKRLPVYTIRESRVRPDDGKTVYFCGVPRFYLLREADLLEFAPHDCERGGLVLEGECFSSDDIEAYEAKYPEILWTPTLDEDKDGDKPIPADEVRKQLGMSPIQFVDMLNGRQDARLITSWEEWYRDSDSHWFETHKINDVAIHPLDLEEYLHARARQLEPVPSKTSDGKVDFLAVLEPSYTELKAQLAEATELVRELDEARQRIAFLEAECAKDNSQQYVNIEVEMSPVDSEELDRLAAERSLSPDECLMKCVETAGPMFNNFPGLMNVADGIRGDKHRISELEKQVASLEVFNAELSTTRTQAATNARQEKILDSWKGSFKTMIPVILHCRTDGPKKRTKAELQSMCAKHRGELTMAQLEFLRECLRECLGEEHVNTEGGPTLQS